MNHPRPVLPLIFLLCLSTLAIADEPAPPAESEQAAIRIGLTPVFLDNRVDFLRQLRSYFEEKLGEPVTFVQRHSYSEVVDGLRSGQIDFAWLCGLPYVQHHNELQLVAVPLFEGRPFYRSYLIVPQEDGATESILALQDSVFAFADPDSNSGYLVPRSELQRAGLDSDNFFSQTFFTWSHTDVINAVASRLAAGGAVDSYVWESLAKRRPELTARTRVAWRSPEFGFPPFVSRADIDPERFSAMQALLLQMADNGDGAGFLAQLNLDGFSEVDDSLYDDIREVLRR